MSVNLTNTWGCTPLHTSAKFGHLDATKTLVERGVAMNYTDKYGATPRMVAAKYEKFEILLYLTNKR